MKGSAGGCTEWVRDCYRSLKKRHKGLDEAAYVESFLVLNAVGGEWTTSALLREDVGLPASYRRIWDGS